MSYTIKKNLTKYNFNDRNDTSRIKYIVIHYFGSLGSAESVSNYFASAYRGASAHYAVDDGPIIYQCVEDGDISWHCGTDGTYYSKCRNSTSIGIEVRPYKLSTKTMYASDTDWYFHDKTIENTVELVKDLMKKYNVPISNVIRHYDVTHKLCPRPYVGSDINSYYNKSGDAMWSKFKAMLVASDDKVNDKKDEDDDMVYYKYLKDIPNTWDKQGNPRACISTLMDVGMIKGDGSDPTGNNDIINLSYDSVRMFIMNYRGGCYDRLLKSKGLDPVIPD